MPGILSKIFYLIRKTPLYLIIDLGTTNIKGALIDENLKINYLVKEKNKIYSPSKGFSEQNPTDWFFKVKKILEKLTREGDIKAIGITGQRETLVVWDKNTGMAIEPAILWFDKRTKKIAESLKNKLDIRRFHKKTGLFWHYRYPLFKIIWLFKNSSQLKNLFLKNRIAFGPPTSYLLYNFSLQRKNLIDHSQASRTLLYNLKNNHWDKEILELFKIPLNSLPQIKPNYYLYGHYKTNNKKIPILSMIGDQEAALVSHSFKKGTTKFTLGTGLFLGKNIGTKIQLSSRLETSVAFFTNKPFYMHEARFSINGKKLFGAIKNNDKEKLNIFKKELKKFISLISSEKIYVDGGLVRNDVYGEKAKEFLQKIFYNFIFEEQNEGTSLGVAKIINKFYKN